MAFFGAVWYGTCFSGTIPSLVPSKNLHFCRVARILHLPRFFLDRTVDGRSVSLSWMVFSDLEIQVKFSC